MASASTTVVAPAAAEPNGKKSQQTPPKNGRPSRPPRPNYKHIHRFPLPLDVHPLPPLIPHNPLSIISIALSYLTYLISPPPPQKLYSAYFDALTSSVHVTDEKTIRALWEMGFFGKGNLSRSEPSWLDREKKRRGLLGVDTSEEATAKRRMERREFKLERARLEREAIAEQLKLETAGSSSGSPSPAPKLKEEATVTDTTTVVDSETRPVENEPIPNGDIDQKPANGAKTVRFSPTISTKEFYDDPIPPHEEIALKDEEHLQLSMEEAFFLVYGLGVLQVYDSHGEGSAVLPASSLLPLFRRHSYFPPRNPSVAGEPDDPFMISYVVNHHFRSLGWIVRSGVKFGVDYLLYNRGPVFSHAEFAVCVLPSYADPYWRATDERREMVTRKESRTWWWLHCVNRVQAQVKKTLMLCYVEIPPPSAQVSAVTPSGETDIGALLRTYKVREISIRRWVPNRSRD